MNEKSLEKELSHLEKENLKLKKELERRDLKNKEGWEQKKRTRRWVARVFLGWRLQNSIRKLFDEIADKKISRSTLSDVATHIIWRFTRIGLFALLAALVPITFLAIQTYILGQQNKKLDIQNRRLEQQTYLQEAERRSSLVFLFNNIMDKMDEELKDSSSVNRTLTPQLIGRIVALSRALKPYKHLENDSIIKMPTSPERGQLLVTLINSDLDSLTYSKIFRNSDFSYAELSRANLRNANLVGINLSHSFLDYAVLTNADLKFANFSFANLENANLEDTRLEGTQFFNSNLKNATLRFSWLSSTNFEKTDLRNADLSYTRLSPLFIMIGYTTTFVNADMENVIIKKSNLRRVDFSSANLRNADLSKSILEGANFNLADLKNANLSCSDLRQAYFSKTNLNETNIAFSVIHTNSIEEYFKYEEYEIEDILQEYYVDSVFKSNFKVILWSATGGLGAGRYAIDTIRQIEVPEIFLDENLDEKIYGLLRKNEPFDAIKYR